MNILNKTSLMVLIALIQGSVVLSSAVAHRFNVALVLPVSGSAAGNGEQIRKGFMLATTERDAHADEESDGHLGGLDSYVSVIDANGDVAAGIKRLSSTSQINIVASFAPDKTQDAMEKLLAGTNIALLRSGPTPFGNKSLPAVSEFIAAFHRAYGTNPTAAAARGYNAARRIDMAVRAQGSVNDVALLRQSFRHTAATFNW